MRSLYPRGWLAIGRQKLIGKMHGILAQFGDLNDYAKLVARPQGLALDLIFAAEEMVHGETRVAVAALTIETNRDAQDHRVRDAPGAVHAQCGRI